MKVMVFLPSGVLGGAEQVLLQLANSYAARGAKVTVIVLTNLNLKELLAKISAVNIDLISIDAKRESVGVLKLFYLLLRKYPKYQFDYVFSSHVHINAFISTLRKLSILKIDKHVVRESTLIFSRFKGYKLKLFNALYDIGYNNVDIIICQTEEMKVQLKKNKPNIDAGKMRVINNPITPLNSDFKFYNPFQGKEYIVSAGRLINEKGFDILINAFSEITKLFPGLNLIILGEGKNRKDLECQIQKLNLMNKVCLVGRVENVYDYFKFAKACVVSSRIEGFPNVLLQMMMVNNAVVSTLCAEGINIIEGVTTCITEDEQELKNAIVTTLRKDNSVNRNYFNSFLQQNNIDSYCKKIEYFTNGF